MTGERIPLVVGQDGGGSMLQGRYMYVYNLDNFRDWLFTRGILLKCSSNVLLNLLRSHFCLF